MAMNKVCMALAAALFLSLSVNFFLAGLMLGDSLTPDAPPVVAEERMLPEESRRAEWKKREEALRAALSPADQDILQQSTERHKQKFDALKADLDEARQNVAIAMTTEPFDQDALDAAIEAEAAVKAQFMREVFRSRRDVMEQLSPDGRKIFQEMNPVRRRGQRPPQADKEEGGHPSPRRVEAGGHEDMRRQRRERLESLQERGALPERLTPRPPGSPRLEEMPPPPSVPAP